MDSNDHYPEFGRDIYEGSVMEELEVDSPVTVVSQTVVIAL